MLTHPLEQEKKSYKLYQVDAFSQQVFSGNPAAVCLLPRWIAAETMQAIAAENNLAETAFLVKNGYLYDIRWFTPTVEVDLCGHATLAAAHILFEHEGVLAEQLIFSSKSGELKVRKDRTKQWFYTLGFPQDIPVALDTVPTLLAEGIPENCQVKAFLRGKTDYVLVLEDEAAVLAFNPNLESWRKMTDSRGVLVTATGNTVDFVSRCFFPQSGIDEDPVTGSAHTTLTPYWSEQLGKKELFATQLSARKGHIQCKWIGQRVELSGYAITYLQGQIDIG